MDSKLDKIKQLLSLGLDLDEAKTYLALLNESLSILEISRQTGINRSTVYRVVESLEKLGLTNKLNDGSSIKIEAASPDNLEKLVVESEIIAERMRKNLPKVVNSLRDTQRTSENMEIRSYTGQDGLKQMLWNELKTKSEIVIFSYFDSLNVFVGAKFADKFRGEIITRGITQRAISNDPKHDPATYSSFGSYFSGQTYSQKYISKQILPIGQEISVHDSTVYIYMLSNGQYIGTEIHDKSYADLMRAVFENFWSMAA